MRTIVELIFIIAWLGMLCVSGYVVAPILFAHLPKMTAGNIAGELFHVVSYVGIVAICGLWFSGCLKYGFRNFFGYARSNLLWLGLLLIIIQEWLITPVIAALKTHTSNWLYQYIGGSFAMWHGVSEIIYLLTTIVASIFAIIWVKSVK